MNSGSDKLNEIASTHLGSEGSYAVYTDKFDASLLVRMPRRLAREKWGITTKDWVSGEDVWHCHESTFLTSNGLPVAGTLKLSYSANSEFMVESKSIKLYLNSFDMCKMGDVGLIENAICCYELQVKSDLEKLLETRVDVCFHKEGSVSKNPTIGFSSLLNSIYDLEDIKFSDYKSEKNHLIFDRKDNHRSDVQVFTNILRSRCRHTKQKDTGSAYIRIQTEGGVVNPESLLKQIVSLREENEFHEFCCEKLFHEIVSLKGVTGCMVMLLYARRGSLDINPVRTTHSYFIPEALRNVKILTGKTQGQ